MDHGGIASFRVMKVESRKKKIFMHLMTVASSHLVSREHSDHVLHTACSFAQPPKSVPIAKPASSPWLGLDPSKDCTVQGQAGAE